MSTFPDHVENILSLQKLGVDISEHLEDGEVSLDSWHYDNLVYLMRQSLGKAYAFKSERDTLAQRVKVLEADKRELLEVLKYYRDIYSGAEPSVSVFDRKVFAALAKHKGEG